MLSRGGASAGVSGSGAAGYLSGNGLLTATVLGRLAGEVAALGKRLSDIADPELRDALMHLGHAVIASRR